jgi:hypothetical protein
MDVHVPRQIQVSKGNVWSFCEHLTLWPCPGKPPQLLPPPRCRCSSDSPSP